MAAKSVLTAFGRVFFDDKDVAGVANAIKKAEARRVGDSPPLQGAPTTANIPNVGKVDLGENSRILESARAYTSEAGIPFNTPRTYEKVDPEFAKNVADEFDMMKHDPNSKEVKESYQALADETLEQYKKMIDDGVKPFFIKEEDNIYPNSPYESLLDLTENNRLGVFPTSDGFGDATEIADNPLLKETGLTLDGKPLLYNDAFRAVHDYYGHAKSGLGFRAAGEENAYRSHAGIYSDKARRAAATETRGQNSWLNFGPYGEKNRTAQVEDTVFADQKTGLLPNWAVTQRTPLADDRRKRFFESLEDDGSGSRSGLKGAIDDEGRVKLTHYSRNPVERIDPAQYGKGLSKKTISERNRAFDPSFRDRSFYGIEGTDNPYKKEAGLGGFEQSVEFPVEQIYDIEKDPDNLRKRIDTSIHQSPQEQITQLEKSIHESGYSGFFNRSKQGDIATIFDPLTAGKRYVVPFTAGVLGVQSMLQSEEAQSGPLTAGAKRIIDARFSSALGGSPRKGLIPTIEGMETGIDQRAMDKGGEFNLYDFEGSPYILTQSDRSAAGGEITSVHGKDIDPVDLRGGRDFMFDPKSEGQVWASDPNVVKSLHKRASQMRDEYGESPLLLPYSMAPTGIDFATMPIDTMISYARAEMSKGNIKKLDKKIKDVIPEWKGVADPEAVKIFRDVKGPSRKKVADIMDKEFRGVKGGMSIAEARAATSDAAQYMVPEGNIKNIGRIDVDRGLIDDSGHPTYIGGLAGEGVGTFTNEVNVRPFMAQQGRALSGGPSDIRALSMNHSLSQGVIDEKLLRDMYGAATPSMLAGLGTASAGALALTEIYKHNMAQGKPATSNEEQQWRVNQGSNISKGDVVGSIDTLGALAHGYGKEALSGLSMLGGLAMGKDTSSAIESAKALSEALPEYNIGPDATAMFTEAYEAYKAMPENENRYLDPKAWLGEYMKMSDYWGDRAATISPAFGAGVKATLDSI